MMLLKSLNAISVNVEEYRHYCIAKKGVTESFPFDEVTLVFKVMGKIFAILPLERNPSQVNLKCDPERAVELRESFDGHILPGYHMNKVHWNTVHMEHIPPGLLLELTDHSYELIVDSLPKKIRLEWKALD